MFLIDNKTIKITRGDTGIFTLDITSTDGTAYNYSNDTVKFTVKKNTGTDEILIQKNVTYNNNVTISPSDTSNLAYGEYVYDVQVTTAGGIVDTIIPPNKFIVMQEVTF